MNTVIFDCETNGLLNELDRVHCLVLREVEKDVVWSCTHSGYGYTSTNGVNIRPIEDGLRIIMDADLIIGHNIIKFDIPALQKVYPWFQPKGIARDTLVMARLFKPDMAKSDLALTKKGKLPKNMTGRYSLESFGYRLGEYKGDYKGGWESWSREMQEYCEQDVEVTLKLWDWCQKQFPKHSDLSIELEHHVQQIIFRQERNGFGFNRKKAEALCVDLMARRNELEKELQVSFPPWEVRTPFTPKVNNKKLGYSNALGSTKLVISLSHEENFRKDFYPAYKGNRSDKHKPVLLKKTRAWLSLNYECFVRPRLEADDVLGILSTASTIKGEKVIVSIDKDFKTIPGLFFNPDKDTVPREISREEADYWHLYQTLIGDAVDGYPGLKGCGPKTAEKALSVAPTWATVVSLYEAKGKTEEDALVMARCARILRNTDFDFKKKEPILWSPTVP